MKTFAEMPIEEFEKLSAKIEKEWRDLERNNPEEYERRVAAMRPIIDRYESEVGIGDDEIVEDYDEN